MSPDSGDEAATMEDEDSPSCPVRVRELPEYSPISYLDNDYTVHYKIEYATRKVWSCMAQRRLLFPESQWRSRVSLAEWVLWDWGLLRHIVPCVIEITNLDGKVWLHRMSYEEKTTMVCYPNPGPPGR